MNKLKITVVVMAISLAVSVNAMAENMSKEGYKSSGKKESKSSESKEYKNTENPQMLDYMTAKAKCRELKGNAQDVCMAEAKGNEMVGNAELEAKKMPSKKATYKASVARAEADYGVAKAKCGEKTGNDKDVCVKEAKAALTHAKADATAQLKTSKANAEAAGGSSEDRMKAKEKASEARSDAAADKRDADYAVAKEKCDALSGDAKDSCVTEAKKRYGK